MVRPLPPEAAARHHRPALLRKGRSRASSCQSSHLLRPPARYTVYKDHITLEDYEIHDGMGLELYYN